jgi:SAM-dependent methyltransferase
LGYALARAGHQVTLTDFSPAMLSIARERLSDYPVAFDKLDLSADHSLLAEPRFDLIACHNVIEYLAGPQRAAGLARLVRALLPRGVLSLAFGNAHHAPLQSAIVKHDFERACRELAAGAPESTSIFGTPTYVMNLDEVHSHLGSHNMAVHAVHGIRCATDLLDEHTVAEQSYEALLTLERALTLQTAYVGMARFVQVIAIKRPA